jgi:hypothetical protein
MLAALGVSSASASAQTLDDGLLIPKKTLTTGVMYAHDSWNEYWEGSLKRTNGNIGTLTTQSVAWVGGYGVTDRLSLMATLPYVWTHASQGVLHDLSGFQDLTFAAKYRLLTTGPASRGTFSAFLVGAAAAPIGDYTPDFYPLSIGTGGGRASARLTMSYESTSAWFVNASSGYTFCSNIRLNRNSYFTDGQLYLTNEVKMPNVLENSFNAGVTLGNWRLPLSLTQRRTLGGGDIRRQDMPFVSNRMDFVRLDGGVMYRLPKSLSVGFGAGHVLNGRNVGQSTTFTSGLSYALHL